MIPIERADFRTKLIDLFERFRPRPNTGSLLQDISFLLMIIFVQTSVLPKLLPRDLHLDLMTAWLLITFINQKFFPAITLAVIGATALEMRSAVPSGLYVSAYCILLAIIHQIKPKLFWRHQLPWIIIFALASLWISLFESLVVYIISGAATMTWNYWLSVIFRIIVVTTFGIYISFHGQMKHANDEERNA